MTLVLWPIHVLVNISIRQVRMFANKKLVKAIIFTCTFE